MKTKQYWLSGAAAFIILAALSACQNPLSFVQRKTASGSTSGVIAVNIDPISPWIAQLVAQRAGSLSRPQAVSRAYAAADNLHFILNKGSDFVADWDQPLAPPQSSASNEINNGSFSFNAPYQTIAVGDNYTLSVQIYNAASDPDHPVVGGTSAPFNVTAQNTANNPVAVHITCVPINPIQLTVGVPSAEATLATPWLTSSTGGDVISIGSEQWYKIEVDGSTPNREFVVTPSAGSQAMIGFAVYAGDGSLVGTGGFVTGQEPGDPAVRDLPASSGTYYICVVDAQFGSVESNGPFTVCVTDIDPIVGNWALSTFNGVPAAEQGMCENLVYRSDGTASVVLVMPNNGGGMYVMHVSGTWSNEGSGTYSGTFTGAGISGTGTSTATMSADGQTITGQWNSVPVFIVRGSVVLPPTELVAKDITDSSVSTPAIELQWSPSASSEVTGYEVYRGSAAGGESVLVTTTGSSTTSWTDSGSEVQVGDTYYYVIYAVAGPKKSPIPSNETYATPGNSGNLNVGIQ